MEEDLIQKIMMMLLDSIEREDQDSELEIEVRLGLDEEDVLIIDFGDCGIFV